MQKILRLAIVFFGFAGPVSAAYQVVPLIPDDGTMFSVTVDKLNSNLWIANSDQYGGNRTVSQFASNGTYISQFSPSSAPLGVATDTNGLVYVAETDGVEEFNSFGAFMGKISPHLGIGTSINSIAIDSTNNIWINSGPKFGIEKYNNGGTLLVPGLKGVVTPTAITVDNSGNLWVVDDNDNATSYVQEFSNNGQFVRKFLVNAVPPTYGTGIAVDSLNNVWVYTAVGVLGGTQINEYTSYGLHLQSFQPNPNQVGSRIYGMSIDSSDDLFFSGYFYYDSNRSPLGLEELKLGALSAPKPGDINRDGQISVADLQAMMSVLTNPEFYKADKHVTDAQELTIADVNGDGVISNADLSALIGLLRTGGGSVVGVPEPRTVDLAGVVVLAVLVGWFAAAAHLFETVISQRKV